jgi:hypothetical protein
LFKNNVLKAHISFVLTLYIYIFVVLVHKVAQINGSTNTCKLNFNVSSKYHWSEVGFNGHTLKLHVVILHLMHYWTVNQHLLLNTAKFHTPIINSRPERKFLYLSSIYLCLYSPYGPWPLFQFLNLYAISRTPWMGDQPIARRYLHTEQHKQNKRAETSMPRVGFEPMIPVIERAKTFHASGHTAIVTSTYYLLQYFILYVLHVMETSVCVWDINNNTAVSTKRSECAYVICTKNTKNTYIKM